MRDLITRRFRKNAAKTIETLWDLDARTARNVVDRGCVSERTLTKAAKAERWALWMALGEELFEEPYEHYLQSIIDETARAKARAEERRD
ncbi:MAG: hypothetical protein Q8R82_01580, partial [Hyphomonadaceae bacterium]|nr:hypothetical protein [Hyphomonadaceae bacterium]